MKFFFFMHFLFFLFKISERNRHQTSVSLTPQIGHRSLFVFFSVMSFSSVASPTSTFQPQKKPQPKFKIRKSRSETNAAQSNETEFSTNVDSSSNSSTQPRSRKKIQTINIFAVRVLLADLIKGCPCKNEIQWKITKNWIKDLHKTYQKKTEKKQCCY